MEKRRENKWYLPIFFRGDSNVNLNVYNQVFCNLPIYFIHIDTVFFFTILVCTKKKISMKSTEQNHYYLKLHIGLQPLSSSSSMTHLQLQSLVQMIRFPLHFSFIRGSTWVQCNRVAPKVKPCSCLNSAHPWASGQHKPESRENFCS